MMSLLIDNEQKEIIVSLCELKEDSKNNSGNSSKMKKLNEAHTAAK